MSDNRNDIVSGLNQIFEFLGPHGGEITIEDDWDFNCKVYNDDGIYKARICSYGGDFFDPLFMIEITFDEEHKRIIEAKPYEYLSQSYFGQICMDIYDDSCKYEGDCDSMEEDIRERLVSYLGTITEVRPYLKNPKTVVRYEKDGSLYG